MSTETHPLTSDRWADLERLFGANGANSGCWCMWWFQTNKEFETCHGEENRASLRARVESGPAPGLLAYIDGATAGWCAVGPREGYGRLSRSRVLKPVDGVPAWSIVCLFVGRAFRGRGVTGALIEAAVAYAADQGATIVEGYPKDAPVDGRLAAGDAFVGTPGMFERAGFREAARGSKTRTTVRKQLP